MVACPDDTPGDDESLVTSQELAFDGTVVATRPERNADADYRTQFLDDGLEDQGAPPPDDADVTDPDAGAIWPWTTFEVNAWYTADWGAEFTLWTAGLDLEPGDRMLISGAAFTTSVPENVAYSGMATVCASAEHSPDLAADWDDWFGGSVEPGGDDPEGDPDPTAVAEIEAGRQLWNDVKPTTYSATIYASDSIPMPEPGGGCPFDGSVRIVVVDGVLTSAVNEFRGCRIDVSTTDVPTIDQLFDEAIRAQGATTEHSYTLSPKWGFPVGYHGYDRSVEISGGVSWFRPASTTTVLHDELADQLPDLRAKWEQDGPDDYTFVLDRLCFCGEVGPYRVSVRDGEPASMTDAQGKQISAQEAEYLPESIDELFDILERDAVESDLVVATFDDELGYPLQAYVDSISNAVDDEVTYVVRKLTPG